MVRFLAVLACMGISFTSFGVTEVQCGAGNGTYGVSFHEGGDEYVLTFSESNLFGSLGAKFLGHNRHTPMLLEVRVPKHIRQPAFEHGCFLSAERPFLFTCPERAPDEARLLITSGPDTGIIKIPMEKFSAQVKNFKRVGRSPMDEYRWSYEAVVEGKKYINSFVFSGFSCKPRIL